MNVEGSALDAFLHRYLVLRTGQSTLLRKGDEQSGRTQNATEATNRNLYSGRYLMKYLTLIAVVLLLCGCTTTDSGRVVVDPNFVASAEAITETGAGIAGALTPLLGPVSGLIGGGLLTGLGLWRKVKPRIMDAEGKAEIGHAATASLVEAIETLKRESPQDWERLKPRIDQAIATARVDPRVVNNVIRGIRGLPPKG